MLVRVLTIQCRAQEQGAHKVALYADKTVSRKYLYRLKFVSKATVYIPSWCYILEATLFSKNLTR